MMNCPYCKIEVGGDLKKCPFCQSKLNGEPERAYFPTQITLKIQSFFYKLQLFLVWTAIISSLGLDFLFHVKLYPGMNYHWSMLVFMWLAVVEFGIIRLFKRGMSSSRIMTIIVFITIVMTSITAYYFGYLRFMLETVVPVVLMCTMIANFVLAMIDKNGNSMVYLLSNLVVGILPYVVLYFLKKSCPPVWIVSLLISVIVFVGAIIFKGREVISEIQRRLNM